MSTKLHASIVGIASCLVYGEVIQAPFLHDDNPAILKNPDVQGVSSISEICFNDFWGTNIKLERSHKSYRPLTVLFFRLLHYLWGNWAPGFHACNVVLHGCVSTLFFFVCRKHVFNKEHTQAPFITALLFGLHPIHTEAVCGTVGCAELLSAFCFMLALLVHPSDAYCLEKFKTQERKMGTSLISEEKHPIARKDDEGLRRRKPVKREQREATISPHDKVQSKEEIQEILGKDRKRGECYPLVQAKERDSSLQHFSSLFLSLVLALAAMLCKESGITVLGVLLACEGIHLAMRTSSHWKSVFQCLNARFTAKVTTICFVGIAIILLRMWIMEWKGPTFNPVDNPASHEKERITRILTYFSLLWINVGLLLFPFNLCYDYSFSTIPLITSVWQRRNIISLHFLLLIIVCSIVGINLLLTKNKMSKPFVMGCSLMIFPFLPASNLFFPVGFVVAERCLYLPSAGFLVLFVLQWHWFAWFPSSRNPMNIAMGGLIIIYVALTMKRSLDWTSKQRFFSSGYNVNPNNPKIIYNWANYLRNNNRSQEAVEEYRKVLKIHPTYASAINNLATILEKNPSTMKEAQELYARVIQMEPFHKNAYINLALILLKEKKYQQVAKVLIRAVRNVQTSLKSSTMIIQEMIKQNATVEAEQAYFHMLNKVCLNTDKLHVAAVGCSTDYLPAMRGYADLMLKKGHKKAALRTYNKAVNINPKDADTSVGLSKVLLSTKGTKEAIDMMLKAVEEDQDKAKDAWEMASTLFHNKMFVQSLKLYKVVADIIPDDFDAVGQYAALLSEVGETELAEKMLLNLTSRDQDCLHVDVWTNLATLYGRRGKHDKAIILINGCIGRLQAGKQQKVLLLYQLGKHQQDRSKQLFKKGFEKEADELLRKSLQSLKEADGLNPANTEASIMIERPRAEN